ncbi:hypothetical protein PINS_up006388 [Pythium insidiosum]|nr:hypothetical protein PINS_up006388 [Pythium insidiosum]
MPMPQPVTSLAPMIALPLLTIRPQRAQQQRHLLAPLRPSLVLPEDFSGRTQALTSLNRIDSARVVRSFMRDGHRLYVIAIRWKMSESRIPTLSPTHALSPTHRGVSIEEILTVRRYSEFVALSDDVYNIAVASHPLPSCRFCADILTFVHHGECRPHRSDKMFNVQCVVHTRLETFLNELLSLTVATRVFGGSPCVGQDEIPQRVERFLLDPASRL